MRPRDRQVEIGATEPDSRRQEARRVGEKLLFLDELEETLEEVRSSGGESQERIDALERRLSAERDSVREMENRGDLRYDEIAEVMEAVDRSG